MSNNTLKSSERIDALLEPRYTLKDLDLEVITYRTINYWDKSEFLLRKRRKTDKGWRRFSLIEFLWIKLLDELRKLNVTLESTIPLLFKAVEYVDGIGNKKEIEKAQRNFLAVLTTCIDEKKNIRLNIFTDKAEFTNNEQLNNSTHENYISISVNKLLIDFIVLQKKQGFADFALLTENESELLNLLVGGSIVEIEVKTNIDTMKMNFPDTNNISDTQIAKITEIFFIAYMQIIYKTKGGKVVIIER